MVTVLSLTFTSCEKEEIINENDLSFLSKEERIQNLNNLSSNFATYNSRVKVNSNLSKSNNSENQILLNDIILQSKSILSNLGLNENDLSEIPKEELEKFYVTFGAAMVTKHNSTLNSANAKSYAAKKGDTWDCFKSAVGVDAIATLVEAGYELYAGETAAGWAVDSAAATAFRKAGVEAAKKVITRWAGFFGAAVVVGEFLWCMAN